MGLGYDANGRIVKATKASTPDALSVYDAAGMRVAERVNDVWRFMIYGIRGKLVAEYGGVQPSDEGGVKYLLSDWQGSMRAVVNSGGYVQSRLDYTAFGEDIGATTGLRSVAQGFSNTNQPRQKFGLTERDDATGLDHTWFRKNENRAGRWTSPDPYNGSASVGNPQSFNRFSYVENQPTNFVDPTGLLLAILRCKLLGEDSNGRAVYGDCTIEFLNIGSGPSVGPGSGGNDTAGGGVAVGGQPAEPPPIDCNELAKQIKKFLNSLQRRARQLMQNLGGLEGPQLDIYANRFKDEQQGLRNRLDEWNTGGCGGPGPTSGLPENVWKWATDPPPPPGISPSANKSQMVQVATGVVVTIGVAYVLYRIVRMVPSLAPPLWGTIPINVAIP